MKWKFLNGSQKAVRAFCQLDRKKKSLEIPRINFIDLSLQSSLTVNFFFSIGTFPICLAQTNLIEILQEASKFIFFSRVAARVRLKPHYKAKNKLIELS